MAKFMIRVVLHGATSAHYEKLHEGMTRNLAARQIQGGNGVWYDLPDGNYTLDSTLELEEVRDRVQRIAQAVKPHPDPSILVTEGLSAWALRVVPGDS